MNSSFTHLHVHSDRSALDGIIRIPDLVAYCKANGMKSVAITDHGVVAGAIRLYEECKKAEIKPIIGMESYLSPTDDHTLKEPLEGHPPQQCYHLTLLAKNEAGVKQLYKLSSIGFLEGFYHKPRISLKLIEEIGHDLIIMGACAKGPISWNLLNGNKEAALDWAVRLTNSFRGRFWIEMMDHNLNWQKSLNEALLEISKNLDIPWVPTNDAHFLKKEDHSVHQIMMCIQLGETLDNLSMSYPIECYVKTPEEMISRWGKESCLRTVEISEMIDIHLTLDKPHFPIYEEG